MPSKTALFIVDVQGDFLPPNGSLQVPSGLLVIPAIAEVLDDKRWEWDVVVASQVRFITHHPPLPPYSG